MATWPETAGFADRHMATMGIMRALKSTLDLPQPELIHTARELEEECLRKSTSKNDYLRLVSEREATLEQNKQAAQTLPVTTGVSEQDNAESRDVGKYKAVYHARSLNSVIWRQVEPEGSPKAVLKVVALSTQMAPHDILKEAEFMRLTAKCPSVIELLSSEQMAGGLFALRLPYMRYDLASLAEQNVLSAEQKRQHLRDLFTALAAVHELGVVHRDVKPSNILLNDPEGPAYLSDFGISWQQEVNTDETADAKITDVGTGCYRAPEVLFGCHDYVSKFDMWAAGCTMFEVLAGGGRTLFDAGPMSQEDYLGSDLRLINSMFQTRGTPTHETWPEAKSFRDWGKITFKEFPAKPWTELLPGVDNDEREVVARLVVYESSDRLSAAEVLQQPYFNA